MPQFWGCPVQQNFYTMYSFLTHDCFYTSSVACVAMKLHSRVPSLPISDTCDDVYIFIYYYNNIYRLYVGKNDGDGETLE